MIKISNKQVCEHVRSHIVLWPGRNLHTTSKAGKSQRTADKSPN